MRTHQGNLRDISRLLTGLFSVQLVLAGFCLLTNDAHAQPMMQTASSHAAVMVRHCSKPAYDTSAKHQHSGHQHSDGCFHCDDQNIFVSAVPIDLPVFSPMLSVVTLPEARSWMTASAVYGDLMPTGPPRSSTLLYTITQRIRV